MTRTIAQRELRNQNAAIMAAVAAGETFVITRNGTPVAELRPIGPQRRKFVTREAIAEVFGRGPRIGFKKFREDSDRYIDPYISDPYI
ncbi:MAG TPA: type II toxin-antitoxin system prevent-host-death family antitoxin [Dehalococcoidia bacterium]|nr:type II toxin-antitoxin system prevent-host-death family antitoxin [Dehalococcoidia bacterium]